MPDPPSLHASSAAYAGRLNCVQELVKAGANAAIVDANGRNALHHACRKDRDEVARFLLETARVDINAFSESKETPLHKAGAYRPSTRLLAIHIEND